MGITPHDYWRVSFLDTQGGGFAACADIQFRPTAGVSITPSGGTAAASSILFGPAGLAFDGNPATGVVLNSSVGWLSYQYAPGTGPAAVELMLQSNVSFFANEGPKDITVDSSDDGVTWNTEVTLNCGGAWTANEIRLFTIGVAATAGIQSSESRTFTIFESIAVAESLSGARVFTVFNFPSAGEQVSANRNIVVAQRASTMQNSSLRIFAVIAGRIANPTVRAWTATLDGHDFYFLRLGDQFTLVYDVYSEQWVTWDSKDNGAWRPNIGTDWPGAQGLAYQYGSSIIAGDDTFGLLWFLDPNLAWDENPDEARDPQQIEFERVATGQVLASGRNYMPCYAIFVDGDNYGLTATDFVPSVVLATSDDQGRNFYDHDTLTVVSDLTVNNPYSWYSLGQFNSPGRMFRITDNGLFTRIDSMSMNDDAG